LQITPTEVVSILDHRDGFGHTDLLGLRGFSFAPRARPTREIEQERATTAALHQLDRLGLTERGGEHPERYVVQVVTSVRATSTGAVQRGHNPMMRAPGPRTSTATSSNPIRPIPAGPLTGPGTP
jgi:hypothetical protein